MSKLAKFGKVSYSAVAWGAIGTVGAIGLDLGNKTIENPANIVILAGFLGVWGAGWLIARKRQKGGLPAGQQAEFGASLKAGTLALLVIMSVIGLVIFSQQSQGSFGWLLLGKVLAGVGGTWIFMSIAVGWWIAIKVENHPAGTTLKTTSLTDNNNDLK